MDLYIRNVDQSLMRSLKVEAATKGITLRAYCIAVLDGEAGTGKRKWNPEAPVTKTVKADSAPPSATAIAAAIPGGKVTVASKLAPVAVQPEPAPQIPACPECGGLRGVHGKWCGRK